MKVSELCYLGGDHLQRDRKVDQFLLDSLFFFLTFGKLPRWRTQCALLNRPIAPQIVTSERQYMKEYLCIGFYE